MMKKGTCLFMIKFKGNQQKCFDNGFPMVMSTNMVDIDLYLQMNK